VIDELIRIFDEFDIFKVIPVMQKFENDYFEYTKVRLINSFYLIKNKFTRLKFMG